MEAETIAVDHDDTLSNPTPRSFNPSLWLPWPFSFLFFYIQLHLIFAKPNREGIEAVKRLMEQGYRVVEISARPEEAVGPTKWWLKRHGLDIQVVCVGPAKGSDNRKAELMREMGITQYLEKRPKEKTVSIFKKYDIKVLTPAEVLQAH